jgi:N,N'-diacetyllegionaminate synthase
LVDRSIFIGKRKIGEDETVFIIAEAGINHNGELKLAKQLVDKAKESKADAIKFQTFRTEDLVTKKADMAEYQKRNIGKGQSQYEMLKEKELSYDEFKELKKYCNEKGIIFLSTPHTEDSIDFLEPLVPAYKIGSGDLTNLPFLEKVAKKDKPIILSTGMGTLGEVEEAVNTIYAQGNKDLILLHCVTNYPAAIENVNLKAMITLKNTFKTLVGFSDHTLGITIPIAAVSLGAKVIEKHFTLDKNIKGPDHKASLNPEELKEMVIEIRKVEKSLGNGIKKPIKEEEKIKKVVRKSLVTSCDIKKGDIITKDKIKIKRPGTGIEPKYLDEVIGKKSKKFIEKDKLLKWDMIS